MTVTFYIAATVAVLATLMVITRVNLVHALLYLVVSLLAVALIFLLLGAPFVAALEIIIYAGAIMVLFVFVVMMLNLGPAALEQECRWMTPGMWVGPSVLSLILLGELAYLLFMQQGAPPQPGAMPAIGPKPVAVVLFGPYVIGVELASVLLLPGLIGAYHLGRRSQHEDR
ncbi:MAG TPA: NADH-quinone oxidoreductase subunit J [Nitrospiraceae bacterium]|nr:NADH-quinone oxidoreductase subunit J [Nitrospiraceae bacterium]